MGDVAQILAGEAAKSIGSSGGGRGGALLAAAAAAGGPSAPGRTGRAASSASATAYPPPPPPPPRSSRPAAAAAAAPYGLSRDVLEILTDPKLRTGDVHAAPLPPMVPSLGYAAARYAAVVSDRGVDGVDPSSGAVGDGDGDAIMEDDADGDAREVLRTPASRKAGAGEGEESKEASEAEAASASAPVGPPPTVPRDCKGWESDNLVQQTGPAVGMGPLLLVGPYGWGSVLALGPGGGGISRLSLRKV